MKNQDDKPVQITISFDAAMATIDRVEAQLTAQKIKCHSGSALGSMFAAVRRLVKNSKKLNDRNWRSTFLRANEALRIANAVEAALNDPAAREAIHRITISDMNLTSRKISLGKDALWELDLYRRFKIGNVPVYFAEPDLIVNLKDNLGEYAIACKKIYSTDNVLKRIRDGHKQLIAHDRPGIIAFNLDELALEEVNLISPTEQTLKKELDKINSSFITKNEHHFRRMIERGNCEGILVSTSVTSDIPTLTPSINTIRSAAAWCGRKSPGALARFSAFIECHDKISCSIQRSNHTGLNA